MRLLLVFITGTLAAFSSPTKTIVGNAPGYDSKSKNGIGLLLAFDTCHTTNGCNTNSTGAKIQIKDDSSPAVLMVAKSCGDLVSSHSASLRKSYPAETSFFMAFTMTQGDVGTIRINKGCVEDGNTATWPTSDLDFQSIQTFIGGSVFKGVSQYSSQPYFPAKLATMRTNDVDVYIPYLLMATPTSHVDALVTTGRRTKQLTYVDATATISLFFSEKMAIGAARAYLLEYTPTGDASLTTTNFVKEHSLTLQVDDSVASYGTKVTAALPGTVVANRLYSLIVEPGALTDVAGNAYGGINGETTATCFSLATTSLGRGCAIRFVVPYKQASVVTYPSAKGFAAMADGAGKNISAGTNVMLTFPDPVYVGSLSTAASHITFSDELARITGDEFLTLLHTGSATHTDYYHAIDSNKVYLLEPRQTLKDAAITKVATTVNVTVPSGTFDYVDRVKFSFPSNPTEFGIKKPEIKYFELYGKLKQNPRYYASTVVDEKEIAGPPLVPFVVNHATPIVLYFDTRVVAQSYKKIVLTPDSYATKQWTNLTATGQDCYSTNAASSAAATASLAPCSFLVTVSGLVTVAQKTKVTIDPGQLIPGEAYTITVQAGAFATDATPSGDKFGNAEWSTRFVVNQQLKECVIGHSATPSVPVHRTTSIRLAFDGPLKVAADGKISVGEFPQLFSDPNAVYYRNNDAATAPITLTGSNVIRYMMILTPRQGKGITGLLTGKAQSVKIEAGAITNFPASSALCNNFETLLEDTTPPRVVSVTNVAGALSEATSLSAGRYQFYSATETAFTITFSEKVSFNEAPSRKPYISLTDGTTTYRFCVSTTTQYSSTDRICPVNSATASEGTAAAGARVWKISIGNVQLTAGSWTLKIPQGVVKDNAHETGGVQNSLDKDYAFGVTVDADVTGPTCTIETNELVVEADGKLVEPDNAYAQTTGTFRHTVVVKFSEPVTIAKPMSAIALVGKNRTNTALVPKQLRLRLDGKNQTSSTSQGAIQFNWLPNGDATKPGGNQIMFLFAKFTPQYNFSSYYFELEDVFAITDLKGNPMSSVVASDQNAATAVLGNCLTSSAGPTNMQVHDPDVHPSDRPTFTVYESAATASCTSAATKDWAQCTASNTSQFLLEFSERVRVNTGVTVAASVYSQNVTGGPNVPGDWPSVNGAQRETIELKSAASAGDLIMSYDGKRAYLEVPYVHLRGKSFEFLQLNVSANAFHDMERKSVSASLGNTTLVKRIYYNGTITNMTSPTGPNVRKERKVEDAVGPTVMMMLPGGVQNGKQALYNISLNANISLKMSEDVYIAADASTKVTLVECGAYMTSTSILRGATGDGGFYPLTNPACTSTTALAVTVDFEMDSTSTTKRKNTTVVINPTAALKPWTKYQMTITAGAFTDTSITPVSSLAISSGTSRFQLQPFFTRGDTAAPTVTTWQVVSAPVSRKCSTTNVDVATLWFDQPIAGYSESAVADVLVSRRGTNQTAKIHCFDGAFSCTITATTDLSMDTTYTIQFPVNIMDLYNSAYTGKLPLVGTVYTFKTKAADEAAGPAGTGGRPTPLFCIVEDPAPYGTSTSKDSWSHPFQKVPNNFNLLLGFTEAVRLAGGYSKKTYAVSTSAAEPKICASSQSEWGTATGALCVDSLVIEMIEGNTVMSVKPTTAPTVSRLWDFFLPAALIQDLAGNAMNTAINGSFCRFETVAPGTVTLDATLPADNDEDVHKSDFFTLKFSETVTSNATADLQLFECGGKTLAGTATDCDSPVQVATIQASQLKFGNKNAIWQQDYTLKQGRRYRVVIEPRSFTSATGATVPSTRTLKHFTVALQNDDFRGTNLTGTGGQLNRTKYGLLSKWGAACVGASSTTCSTQVIAEGTPSAATSDSIYLFFPSKFTGSVANLKVYLNKTAGSPAAAKSVQVSNPTIATGKNYLKIPLTTASEGVTYQLHIYDEAWGVDILEDADTYYWNSGSSTGLKGSAVGGYTTFGVSIPKTYTYYEKPSFDLATNLAGPVNATVDVPVTSMVTLFVKSNLTDLALDTATITLKPYARKAGSSGELAGTQGQTQCANAAAKFSDCCGASSGTALTVTRTYADRVGNITSTVTGDDYVPVYFRPANGLLKYTCYQVEVSASMFDAGGKKNAAYGGYDMWFATADIAAGDIVSPDVGTGAFAVSSKGSTTDNTQVSRSAALSVTFSEAVATFTKSLIALSGGSTDFDASISGSTLTLKPISTTSPAYEWQQGTTHTLTLSPGAVADAAGNQFSKTATYTFTTEYKDGTAPTFLHSLPEVGDEASVNARMVQFMSEAVKPVAGQTLAVTNPSVSLTATQSSWQYGGSNTAATANGLVLFDGSRITTLTYAPLTADASAVSVHLTTTAAAVEDAAGNDATASGVENKVTFQAKARVDFAETTRATGTFGGDVDVALVGATGVDVCGTMLLLGGGASGQSKSDRVCTAKVTTSGTQNGEVAWECPPSAGDRWNRVSAAVDMDCNVWVVGGDGSDTALAMSADTGATFAAATALPLPVCDGSGCRHGDALPTNFQGAAVGVLNGWQVVVCGGGLDRCWVAVSKYGGSNTGFARGNVVDAAVKDRYYGTLLDMGSELYFAGGQDNADNSAVTKCYQDVWSGNGYTFQILTVKHSKENRCSGSFVRSGDGTLYVLGGTNTSDSIRGQGYQVGWESSVYELYIPSSSTRASIRSDEYTYDAAYTKPFIAAVAPSGTGVGLSTTTKTVTIVMSEKVVGAQMSDATVTPVCVSILRNTNAARTTTTNSVTTTVAATTIYCSTHAAFQGKCYSACATNALGNPTGTLVAAVTTSLSGNTLEVKLGSWVMAVDSLTVTFTDGFVQDAAGNLADVGTSTSGRPVSATGVAVPSATGVLTFAYAAAPAAFAKVSQYPATSDVATTNPNFVFKFNEVVSANSGLTLTVQPTTATASGAKYVLNATHTERCVAKVCAFVAGTPTISTAGKLLKISMPAGEFLTMGISYTYTLAASSVAGAVGGIHTSSIASSFTTVNALMAGQSGTVYTKGTVQDSETDLLAGKNDTAGDPKCSVDSAKSPPHATTDVDPAEVHVVVTCSEPVYINRTKKESFSLKWYNTTASQWTLVKTLNSNEECFFDGPNKQMTFLLKGLEKGTKYSIFAAPAEVVRDYRDASTQMGAYTLSSILDANYFFYTSSDVVPTASVVKPKIAAADLSEQLIEGNGEQATYFFMFTAPVELNATALKFSTSGLARPLTEAEWAFSADEVLSVTLADMGLPTRTSCSVTTSSSVYKVVMQQEVVADKNGWKSLHYDGALTSSTACRPDLQESTPYNPTAASAADPNTLKHFGSDSSVVLRFNEAVVAGEGSITLTGTHSGTSIAFGAKDKAVRILDNYVVVGSSEGLQLLPGEEYTVSVQNRTVRSKASLGYLAVPTSYSSKKFSVIPKLDFKTKMASIDINAHGAAVLVDASNKIYVVGGWATPTSGNVGLIGALRSNKTYVVATYRDSDAFSGSSPVKMCSDPDPCTSKTPVYQRADTVVYQSASTRGVRAQNVNGDAYSKTGNVMQETTLGTKCVCPTCIAGPDVTAVTNIVPSDYAKVYEQTPANHSGFQVDCNVGVGELLQGQGYTSNGKQFQCWPAAGSTGNYFGEWKVYEAVADVFSAVAEGTEVCVPKTCSATALPDISNAGGKSVCEGVQAGAKTMPHGQKCTWTCASGYKVEGELSCDRGVFVGGAACVKRECPTLEATGKQVLSATKSVYEATVSVSCATGYKLKGQAGMTQDIACTVNGKTDAMEYSAVPAECEVRTCQNIGALANTDGGCTLDSPMDFLATCSIGCTNGFANADGTKAATAECTCNEAGECSVKCGSAGCDTQCKAAVECNGDDAKASDTANQGTCIGKTVATDGTCTRMCSGGYTVGGTRDGKTAVDFTCSDVEGTGKFSASDKCAERVCDASSLPGLSAATGTIATAAGAVTELACSGKELVGAKFVKCEQGSYIGCDDKQCTAAGNLPSCVTKGAKSEVVPVVQFELELAMDTAWISPSTCGKAKDSLAGTFCGKEYMDCATTGLKLTVTGLSVGGVDPCAAARQLGSEWQRQLAAGDALKIEFEAEAKAGSSVEAASAALSKAVTAVAAIEQMDTTQISTLAAAISSDLTASFPDLDIKVTGVVVTQSARQVSKVVEVKEAPKPAEGGGLGGGAIAGIVIGILVVVGGGFFLMKKGGGASDQA